LLSLSISFLALAQETSKEPMRKRRVVPQESFLLLGKDSFYNKKLKAGEKHIYEIDLKQGEYLSLGIGKQDVDILASLFDPNEKKIIEVSSLNRPQDPEIGIYLLTEISGIYKLEISTQSPSMLGNYSLKIKDLRPSNKQDKERISSQAAYDEAEKLRQQNTKESIQKAFNIYISLLPLWKNLGDREGEAATLNAISAIYFTTGQFKESQQHLEHSLKIWRDLNNPLWEVATLTSLGAVSNLSKDNRQALYYYLKALQLANKLNDPQWLAFAFNGLGKVCSDLGEIEQSINYYNEALAIKRNLKDRRGEAIALSNIANVYISLQNYQASLDHHLESLAVFSSIGDVNGEASTLNNLGRGYMLLNNYIKALESFNLALKKKQELQDLRGQATTFNNIGYLHMVCTEKNTQHFLASNYFNYFSKQNALDAFNQALEIWRKIDDPYEEQTTLALIEKTYTALGDLENANKVSQQIARLNSTNKNVNQKYEIEPNKNTLANNQTLEKTEEKIESPLETIASKNTYNSKSETEHSTLVTLPKTPVSNLSDLNIPNKNSGKTAKNILTNAEITKSDSLKTDNSINLAKTEVAKANKTEMSNQTTFDNKIVHNKPEGGKFSIQVGALSKKEEADVLCNRLRSNGLESYVAEGSAAGKTVFRVRMGHFQSIEEAKKIASQLKAKGAIGEYFIATQ
jgi:tetratricopeptide (TPR) repeat protein